MTRSGIAIPGSDLAELAAQWHRRRRVAAVAYGALAIVLAMTAVIATGHGAVDVAPGRVIAILADAVGGHAAAGDRDTLVVLQVRLPRVLLAVLIGAALAVSGALMQGLFRNPMADPGLIGVSPGAGLAAAATIVLGDRLAVTFGPLPFQVLPAAAFLGAMIATFGLYLIATRGGRTSVPMVLLAGLAIAALAGAGTGLLVFLSDDRQLRDITFWSLGSLGGATWPKLLVVAPLLLAPVLAIPFLSRGLDALAVGEAEAYHMGIRVQRMKTAIMLLTAGSVGAAVAVAGTIGFVGMIVPHLVRLMLGPLHRRLLPAAALLGAALLTGADLVARTVAAPAELPIGILTAAIGAPVFLHLLMRRRGGFGE